MLLNFDNGDPYATGATPYAYRPSTEKETSPRIILTVKIEGITTTAFVDTGGILVISPEIAQELSLNPSDGISAQPLIWRNNKLQGVCHRVALTLIAEQGDSLTIEATAFVPQTPHKWQKDFPCILGMVNCLERLRFAVDPSNDTFYFGELIENQRADR